MLLLVVVLLNGDSESDGARISCNLNMKHDAQAARYFENSQAAFNLKFTGNYGVVVFQLEVEVAPVIRTTSTCQWQWQASSQLEGPGPGPSLRQDAATVAVSLRPGGGTGPAWRAVVAEL